MRHSRWLVAPRAAVAGTGQNDAQGSIAEWRAEMAEMAWRRRGAGQGVHGAGGVERPATDAVDICLPLRLGYRHTGMRADPCNMAQPRSAPPTQYQ